MTTINAMSGFWRRRSLRFWLATGMLMTAGPIVIAAVAGYLLYEEAITQPLIEVSTKQQEILQPLHRVHVSLWDVSKSVVDYAVDGDAEQAAEFRQEAAEIEKAFSSVAGVIDGKEVRQQDLEQAFQEWKEVETVSEAILSSPPLQGQPVTEQRVARFETEIDRLGHRLEKLYEEIRVENGRTHDQALADLVLSRRLTLAGFVGSALFAVLGILVINRSLVGSMDRLVDGAMHLAAGDREHQIEVQIPPELVKVADAFNLMTKQILEQEESLEQAARTDGLTGLYNRREFDRLLEEEVRHSERYGRLVSLIMCDIDHFKRFNDTYGHQAGDSALNAVARTLRAALRDVDRACRFGGEEFALILPECDAEAAGQVAERVREAVESHVIRLADDPNARVTISLGVATFPRHGATIETLLESADAALYRAKEQGRNQVCSAG